MSRSKWKFPVALQSKSGLLKVWNRNSVVSESFLNKNVNIYNGKTFIKMKVAREHFGYKFGEFSFTRKFTSKKLQNSK